METTKSSSSEPSPQLRTKDEPLWVRMILAVVLILFLILESLPLDMVELQPDPEKQHTLWGLYLAAMTGYFAGKISIYRSKKENWPFGVVAVLFSAYLIYKITSAML